MKTLIISGTVENRYDEKNGKYNLVYDVTLYGQSIEHTLVVYITNFKIFGSYNDMQDACRAHYAKYFNTDLFNIISLENLIRI